MLAREISRYVIHDVNIDNIPQNVIKEVKRRVLDSFAVMVGAYNEPPPSIARKVAAKTAAPEYGGTLFGTTLKVPIDYVAFANGCHVRYLDFNDTYLSKEALHPSDMIPALIGVTEAENVDGEKLIEGIVAAYEVGCRLADAASVRDRGWDHVTYITIATAAGAGKIMGLDEDRLYHAINIATVAGMALRQTRAGEISMWKGCAAANSARHGVFAALLAKHGMTGPAPIFEGEMGFFKLVSGDFSIEKWGGRENEPFKILETSIKYYPVEYHSMSAVEAALKIREKLGRLTPDIIDSVVVRTFTVSYKIIVKDPEKWDPKTRETADHSLPYIVASALLDGYIWLDTFSQEKILSKDVRKVMKKMKIEVDPEHDKLYPEGIANTIIVRTTDGRVAEETVVYPRGHFKNPMTDSEIEEKFNKLAENLLAKDRRKEITEKTWKLEKLSDLTELMTLFAIQ